MLLAPLEEGQSMPVLARVQVSPEACHSELLRYSQDPCKGRIGISTVDMSFLSAMFNLGPLEFSKFTLPHPIHHFNFSLLKKLLAPECCLYKIYVLQGVPELVLEPLTIGVFQQPRDQDLLHRSWRVPILCKHRSIGE